MFGSKKLKEYKSKGNKYDGDSDFSEYKPINYRKEEMKGNKSWLGKPGPDYVKTIVPVRMDGLPKAIEDMIDHAWSCANHSPGAQRSGLKMGMHRRSRIHRVELLGLEQPYKKISAPATRTMKTEPDGTVTVDDLMEKRFSKCPHI